MEQESRNTALRASSYEEIEPLIGLCKGGKLFAVQEWIAAGSPVNLPLELEAKCRSKAPLYVAMKLGFHSLVEVLLDGGAIGDSNSWDSPIYTALDMRRFDIVELIIEHGGYDPAKIDMKQVFDCWDPAIMEYFIERGAEVEKGNPLAYALSERIRTALRIYKQYQERFPSFKEQANLALRHHCAKGNLKWVSLMLWAGADPYAPGPSEYDDEYLDDEPLSALGYAALNGHVDVFKLKAIRLDPFHPVIKEVLRYLHWDETGELMQELIKLGVNLNDEENGGSHALEYLLLTMGAPRFMSWGNGLQRSNIDSEESRAKLKMVHFLAKNGANWIPVNKYTIESARKSLLKLVPDYTVEFVWIMSKYKACAVEHLRELTRTPAIKTHIRLHSRRVTELLDSWG